MRSPSRFAVPFVTVMLACVAPKPSLHAQGLRTGVSINIPFDFEDGSHHLPAGRYSFSVFGDSILQVRGAGSMNVMIQNDLSTRLSDQTKLVFHKYGEHYFLSEVWVAGSSVHVICRRGNSEKQEMAKVATPAAQQVAVLDPTH